MRILTLAFFPLVAVLAALAAGGCRKPPPPAPPPPEVEVLTVAPTNAVTYNEWIGTLDGLVHAHVHPQVTGYLLAVRYHEGAPVRKGEVLFEIDPRPFQAVLDQALARLGKDELDVNRLKPLAAERAVSRQELDDATQAYLGDKGAVDQARMNVEFTRVLAPIDGLSGLAIAQIGDLVGPNTEPLTTVSAVDPIKAYFSASEQECLTSLRACLAQPGTSASPTNAAAPFEAVLADGTLYPHRGWFYAADNQVDIGTGALRIAALFPNPDHLLRSGQFARVRLAQTHPDAILVPQRAVIEFQGRHQVAVVGPDRRAHLRSVRTGERAGSAWIVEHGLAPGEAVVVEGVQKARDGQPVNPRPYAPPAPPPEPPTR